MSNQTRNTSNSGLTEGHDGEESLEESLEDISRFSTMTNTEPVTDYNSKTVMLRAERHDPLKITNIVNAAVPESSIPVTFTVAQRTATYYGPELLLNAGDEMFQLTAPGPDTHLLLWRFEPPAEGKKQRLNQIAEIKADFKGGPPSYNICADCGEPIQTAKHERLSLIGRCSN